MVDPENQPINSLAYGLDVENIWKGIPSSISYRDDYDDFNATLQYLFDADDDSPMYHKFIAKYGLHGKEKLEEYRQFIREYGPAYESSWLGSYDDSIQTIERYERQIAEAQAYPDWSFEAQVQDQPQDQPQAQAQGDYDDSDSNGD